MIEACRRGPWGARVDDIDERDVTEQELALRRPGEDFSVLPTV
jgi:acylphosphatase